ncbi:unnamed protein product [Mytilus coruscus]|uniref:Fucolectin tachylectin-4 pentraxin-1 domain-containing protein n=1 Tax=Mytilus coruscus TaxID=42192 RepID=A0A6J8DWT1_MYTCO|nr:unnamed protein product [Mytilus coruscus]
MTCMEWQTILFQSAVIVLLLSVHVYLIERKIIYSNEIIETLVDLQRQTEELKQILKGEIIETSVDLRIKRQTEELKQILKVSLGEIIETSVDLRIKRQTEELKQILKGNLYNGNIVAVLVLLLSFHIYHFERKIVNLGEKIETSVDLRIKRQTEELKQILKERSYESKLKEALHEFKEDLTIALESIKVANETSYEDKYKGKTSCNHDNQVIKEVAYRKVSRQSTQHAHHISGHAIDGNLNTMSHTLGEDYPFWEVDLGSEFKIKQIEIFVRKDCCGELIRKMDILVGPSHNKLEKCAYYKGPAQTGFHLVFECPQILRGRYVKIQKEHTNNLALAEVKHRLIHNLLQLQFTIFEDPEYDNK